MDEETKIQKDLINFLMENNLHTPYAGMEILDVIPQEYKIKSSDIADPIGTVSDQIKGQYLNIIARSSIKQNIQTSFQQAEIEIADFLITPIATANAVLTESEKRSGCVLVDFGAATTTVSIYYKDILRHLVVLPLGGNNITKDICSQQIDEADAEALKIKYGCAYSNPDEKESDNKFYPIDEKRTLSAKKLNEIVESRTEEIIANIMYQVGLSGYSDKLPAGFVLTGGGSNLKKLSEAFSQKYKINKVRIAHFVQWEIKATRPELLIKNGMQNSLFGLLAAGKENCCKIEIKADLFSLAGEETKTSQASEADIDTTRAKQEDEAAQIAQDDDYWNTCQANDEYGKYLDEYPEGRHAEEAKNALRIAEQERVNKEDDEYWESCNSTKQWRKYQRRYPEGRHIIEAEEKLEQEKLEKKENGFMSKLGRAVKKIGKEILEEE